MARKQIIFRWAAREKIPRGTTLLAMSAGEAGVEIDLIEAGIIDPTKVVRLALENAVSVASVLLLTEATMTELPEQRKDHAVEPDLVA